MPLLKQTLNVPLGGGLQTDVDDKLLPLGKVLTLENGYWLRTGEVVKRPGTAPLGTGLVNGGTLPQPYALTTHKGALVSLGVPGPTPLAEWSPTRGQWAAATSSRRGPLSYSLQQVASGFASDVAYASGYLFVIYGDPPSGTGAIWQVAIDLSTGVRVMSRKVAVGGLFHTYRVACVNGFVTFAYINGANLVMDSFQISTLSSTPSSSLATAAVATERQLDVRVTGQILQFCFTSGGNAAAVDLDPAGAVITLWSPRDSANALIPVNNSMGWIQDFGASGKIALITDQVAGGLNVQWNYPLAGATRQAASTIGAGIPANVEVVTGYTTTNSATGVGVILYDNNVTNTLQAFSFGGGTVTAGPAIIARSVLPTSKPWTYGGDYYVAIEHPVLTQYTRYVMRLPFDAASVGAFAGGLPAPLATILPQSGVRVGGAHKVLSSVASPAAGSFVFGLDVAHTLNASVGDGVGVSLVTVTHGATPNTTIGPAREAIDSLLAPGGNLGVFDGVQYGLGGFAYFPDQPGITGAGAGSMTAGATYYYRIVYRRMDSQARVWRSAPSVITSIAMGANTTANLTLPTCRVADTQMIIEVYRGAANDTVEFTFVASVANDPSVDTIAYSDTAADTAIAGNDPLYTNGGVQQNDVTPGFLSVAVAGNRVFGVSADDPQAVWPSQVFTLNRGLGFSVFNAFDVRDQHGAIAGLAAMDDKVAAFKQDAIYVVTGDGPDVLGRGGFNVQLVALGIGAANPQSIVETKDGVMFRSTSRRAGFHLLDRGGSIQYIGAAVQRYNGETIVGSVMLPALNHVRFYCASGRVLVYDTVLEQWATFLDASGSAFAAATVYNGTVAAAHANASVLLEDTTGTVWSDNGTSYGMTIESPWLSLAQLGGYYEFQRIRVIGESVGAGLLLMSLFRDLDDTSQIGNLHTVNFGGVGILTAELRYTAKVSALKVRLVEASTPDPSAGVKLSALALIYGVKAGLRKTGVGSRIS